MMWGRKLKKDEAEFPYGTDADWYEVEFAPQKDITAFELALCCGMLDLNMGTKLWPKDTILHYFSEETREQIKLIRRHFKMV